MDIKKMVEYLNRNLKIEIEKTIECDCSQITIKLILNEKNISEDTISME